MEKSVLHSAPRKFRMLYKACSRIYNKIPGTVSIGLLFALVLYLMNACTEVYSPDLETGQNILYIEGGITDAPGPHRITLRYTSGYNDKPEFSPATGAILTLWEDGSPITQLTEVSDGIYQTDSLFQAIRGRSYKLMIETPNGYAFESASQELPLYNYAIDSVYGLSELRKIKYYNVFGDLVVFDQYVNQMYADIPAADINTYYRFDCQLILEHASGMRVYTGGAEYDPVDLYMWNSFFPDDLSIIEVNAQRDELNKFQLTHAIEDNENHSLLKFGFGPAIQAQYDQRIREIIQVEVETDSGIIYQDSTIYGMGIEIADLDYYYGWIVRINQYSITPEAYTFWSDVQKLEQTEGEIFDPISTQLRGNMVCTSDPGKPMLGLFEVASKTETNAFVNYHSLGGEYPGKILYGLSDFPDRGWKDTVPPDFWVDKIYEGIGKSAISDNPEIF